MYTQGDLARRLGISRRAVAGYELDENEPPMTVVLTWLKACDRPLSDLDDIMALVEIPEEETMEAQQEPARADLRLAALSDRPLDAKMIDEILNAPKANRPSPDPEEWE